MKPKVGLTGGARDTHQYFVKHFTRMWLLVLDRSDIFPGLLDGFQVGTLMQWLPDQGNHIEPLKCWKGATVREKFALSPLEMSCWACFAGQMSDKECRKLLRASDADIWKPCL